MFLQYIERGLLSGAIYALIAVGYSLVYSVLRSPNFTREGLYIFGSYVCYAFMMYRLSANSVMHGTGYWIVGTAAVLGAGIVAVLLKRVLMRPIQERYPLTINLFVALMAAFIFFENLFSIFSDRRFMFQPDIARSLGITRSVLSIITFAVVIILLIGLLRFLKKTKWGAAIRAVADNHGTAELIGDSTSLLISIIFLVAGGLTAIGGFISLSVYKSWINPTKALLAALAGGLGSLPGAVIGSLILGIAEVLSISFLSTQGDTVVSYILIIVILVRYAGFFKKIFIRNKNV